MLAEKLQKLQMAVKVVNSDLWERNCSADSVK